MAYKMWGRRRMDRLEERLEQLEQLERTREVPDVNELATRVERLELDAHQKQLEVLAALDKALHALRARNSVRTRRDAASESPETNDHDVPHTPTTPQPSLTPAHLAARFRRF